jgi:hypothetical protein
MHLHLLLGEVWWGAMVLGAVVVLGIISMFMRPRMRDARLDRTWAGRPGKHDGPARRPRR